MRYCKKKYKNLKLNVKKLKGYKEKRFLNRFEELYPNSKIIDITVAYNPQQTKLDIHATILFSTKDLEQLKYYFDKVYIPYKSSKTCNVVKRETINYEDILNNRY